MPKLFGTDGIRGRSNKEMTPELAFNLGKAIALLLRESKINRKRPLVAVAQDTRTSSNMLFTALSSGLMSYGADVLYFGVLPTPGLSALTRQFNADAAVMVSASHNPMEDNGLKVLNGMGLKLQEPEEEMLEELMRANVSPVLWSDIGQLHNVPNSNELYGDQILEKSHLELNQVPVVVDVAHGATYAAAPYVLQKAGARVHVLFATPDGYWINHECGATHLEPLRSAVKALDVPLGFAFDGDGDRVMAVTKSGRVLDGDDLMTILVKYLSSKGLWDPRLVVGTLMTNSGFEEFLQRLDGQLLRTNVGDKYVSDAMRETGAMVGGEPSGHIIYTPMNITGDGIGIMASILSILSELKADPEDLLSDVNKKMQKTVNVELGRRIGSDFNIHEFPQLDELVQQFCDAGIRIVLRPSGTEPLLRITIEGDEEQVAEALEAIVPVAESIFRE
jgi:phosphoglucosamine mutase